MLDPKEEIVKSVGFTASSPDPVKLCTHFHENSNEFSILHSEMKRLDFSKIRPGLARELLTSQIPIFEEGRGVLDKTLNPAAPEFQPVFLGDPVFPVVEEPRPVLSEPHPIQMDVAPPQSSSVSVRPALTKRPPVTFVAAPVPTAREELPVIAPVITPVRPAPVELPTVIIVSTPAHTAPSERRPVITIPAQIHPAPKERSKAIPIVAPRAPEPEKGSKAVPRVPPSHPVPEKGSKVIPVVAPTRPVSSAAYSGLPRNRLFNAPPRDTPVLPVAVDPELVKRLALDKLTLSAEQTRRVQGVFQVLQAAFSQNELELGQTTLVSHSIDIQNNTPFRVKTRPVPFKAQDWWRAEIDRLLKAQII